MGASLLLSGRQNTNLVNKVEDFAVLLQLLLRQVLELRRKRLDFVSHDNPR